MKIKKEFRIYPFRKKKDVWDKTCWWTVRISKTPEALRKKTVNKKCRVCKADLGGSPKCLGLAHSHGFRQQLDGYGNVVEAKLTGELGVIFLEEGHLGVGVVSHEMCHAMMYTVTRYTQQINFNGSLWNETDENMAYILGDLVNCFYTSYEMAPPSKR